MSIIFTLSNKVSEDEHRCGYCGCIGCHIDLVRTSGDGANKVLGPVSDCEYFVKLSLKWMKESTKNRPSSNHPTKCPLCNRVYWSYNMVCHYKTKHSEHDFSPFLIKPEEKVRVLNF